MRVMIEGQDLTAWALAGSLASTGCNVTMKLPTLPMENNDVNEPDLLRLLQLQLQSKRLILDVVDNQSELLILAEDMVHANGYIAFLKGLYEQDNISFRQLRVIALVQAVPIGTSELLQQWLDSQNLSFIHVVYWPSFVQAGRSLESVTRPERILLGSDSTDATELMRGLLSPFNRSRDSLMIMSLKEAELSKLAINGMLATRVSFMNEIAHLAEQHQVDVERVRQGVGSDSRIGFQYLYPGCGFGGQAFLNTLYQLSGAIDQMAAGEGRNLLRSVYDINEQQKDLLFQKFWRYFRADIKGKRVAMWGCAFKPNTASVEGSPALTLVNALLAHDVHVSIYDPRALESLKKHITNHDLLDFVDTPEQALLSADALMLVTEWKEFWNLDMATLRLQMNTPLLLDGRNIYDPKQMSLQGWKYSGVGRGTSL